ncbi:MAG: hypothetical protein JJU15_07195 [Pararhodobacter sp.]|nr:hypothetical protein [Pararhodobacter sp.]
MRGRVGDAGRWPGRALACALVVAGLSGSASAQDPLSAIDWLRDNLSEPAHGAHPVTPLPGDAWLQSMITTRAIDAVRPESVGLFPAARAGLPRRFWGTTPDTELLVLIRGLPVDTLPALRDLSYRLLLAEFEAPHTPPTREDDATAQSTNADARANAFLAARIDKLMDFGAIDQAAAMLDTLDTDDPGLRQQRFEIALLLEQEQRACASVLDAARPFPFAPAVIFCKAREGDWQGAQEQLERATEAGTLGSVYAPLLDHFLDADDHLHNSAEELEAILPSRLSPLAWRLLEAIGAPVATHGLPVSFAHADLRGTIGWRAQLEAAERLVRSGALPPNQLLGLYTERSAAASGGIWERVRAVQRLDSALIDANAEAIGSALLLAWPHIVEGELEVAFAALFAQGLLEAGLSGEALEQAIIVGLLSADYEQVALDHPGTTARARFLSTIARGLPPAETLREDEALRDPHWAAVAEAFEDPAPVTDSARARIDAGRLGEEVLLTLISLGSASDPRMMTDGLALLRYVGLEDIARRTALQSLLLERRG